MLLNIYLFIYLKMTLGAKLEMVEGVLENLRKASKALSTEGISFFFFFSLRKYMCVCVYILQIICVYIYFIYLFLFGGV